jgi:hypothetical protein
MPAYSDATADAARYFVPYRKKNLKSPNDSWRVAAGDALHLFAFAIRRNERYYCKKGMRVGLLVRAEKNEKSMNSGFWLCQAHRLLRVREHSGG